MARQLREIRISGTTTPEVRDYEVRNRQIARVAAAAGMVLLKNDNNILPLEIGSSVALYGSGATHFVKGGTGSGDVNEREVVSIRSGMKSAGYVIANEQWLDDYEDIYQAERLKWRDFVLAKSKEPGAKSLFEIHAGNPMPRPIGNMPTETDAQVAIYVLSRCAGEGADRKNAQGDYLIADAEYEFVKKLCHIYKDVILVINTGGLIDLSFVDDFANISGIIQMVQPGMEGGNAFADIVSGKVTPSGKMTDSWAYKYEDYPCAEEYSLNGPTLDYAIYKEGIYVGYRYFDSFHKGVRYGFGFGLSYTKFEITTQDVEITKKGTESPEINVTVNVKNIGEKYSGKEVVQVYVSCPDGKIEKEYRRLVGFAKTDELVPGESQTLTISFPVYSCTSYDEKLPGYVLESGYYGIWVGNSLGESKIRGMVSVSQDITVEKTEHVCPVNKEIEEFSVPSAKRESRYRAWVEKAKEKNLPVLALAPADVVTKTIVYGAVSGKCDEEAYAYADKLSKENLIKLATGDPAKAQDAGAGCIGAAGLSVPGSAAETSDILFDDGLGSMVLTDGPAGLRLDKFYFVSPTGEVHQRTFMEKVEDGLFMEREESKREGDVAYYQYCTAFPVGTLLAQSWDVDIVKMVGAAVGEEMMEFQTALWLAPGMNIHRNPLCGRNFEYYSEDPVLSGIIAAAMTRGVQSVPGCGTTIKHFACNSQEENRLHCDSVLNERALREIYLKGFEICIKSIQPMAIMTSYNLVNGIHTANSYDLCSKVARDEWKYAGMIMTDWTTTEQGPDCTASGCMRAGNDLVCPGNITDQENIEKELADGTLKLEDIKACVSRMIKVIWQSNAYVDIPPYSEQFDDLIPFVAVSKEQKQ